MHIFAPYFEYLSSIMRGKQERQRLIRNLIRDHKVASQEELSALLAQAGCDVAQATLSRDIREMRITKVHDGEGYYYRLPGAFHFPVTLGGGDLLSGSVERLEFSGQMAVISTRPGHANMIASVIDAGHPRPIMGTLAGDDTVLLVLREGYSPGEVTEALTPIIKGIESKRVL